MNYLSSFCKLCQQSAAAVAADVVAAGFDINKLIILLLSITIMYY